MMMTMKVHRAANNSSSGVRVSTQRRALSLVVRAQSAATSAPPALPYRIGHGWDLHRLEPGYKLIIGGVQIEHDRGCVAHSGTFLVFVHTYHVDLIIIRYKNYYVVV